MRPATPGLPLVWALPRSLATTDGIAVCFLFLRVLRCFTSPGLPRTAMNLPYATAVLPAVGFPIRTSTDQSLVGGSPWLIAATHVLRRLQEPRHPPHTLSSLVTLNSDLPSLAARATPSRGRDPDPASGTWNREDLAVRCSSYPSYSVVRVLRRDRPEGAFPAGREASGSRP